MPEFRAKRERGRVVSRPQNARICAFFGLTKAEQFVSRLDVGACGEFAARITFLE